ncbi:CPBP family intramembrane metalloprotease [Microcoleus sp. FACHB-1515]|nr:CPBP family intramembrane glutamic endopeptidase [Microcoleus sp. FACHB-1515]MBD2089467.1 CPBP family intramembrane metalloprotease [Microcoleus sp. FACHB-1515]
MQILLAMGLTAIVLLCVARLWLLFDSVQLLSTRWSAIDLLVGVAIGLGISGASSIVYRFWKNYRQSADYYLALIVSPLVWMDLVWLGLLPGLSEELLFRGVMLPAIGLNGFGIFISALCFGVLHFSGANHWAYVAWAVTIGLVLGFSALASGNLLVPIAAHVTTNLLSSCIWKLTHQTVEANS